jgi:hypothetical protein
MIYVYSGCALMSSLMAFCKKMLKTESFWSERQEVAGE